MRERAARAISILGHPAIVLPGVAMLGLPRTADAGAIRIAVVCLVALAMGWSAWQVRRGAWRHIDASVPSERGPLNLFLLALLAIAGTAAVLLDVPVLALGIGSVAVVVIAAMLIAPRVKLSHHVGFATLTVFLGAFAGAGAAAVLTGWVLAVAWSRLVLRRHVLPDILAGVGAGIVAGLLLWVGTLLAIP